MRKLILVKHASPQVLPGEPPERWPLSEAGRAACEALAETLREHAPSFVVTSEETKAAETGQIVAQRLGVPHHTAPDLHEHDRSDVPQLPTPQFISMMELVFRRPSQLVLGRETAVAALSRFESALDEALAERAEGNVVVVSHGTVIALLLEKHGAGRAFEIWRKMKLPSFAVLSLPGMGVENLVASVGGLR